MFSIGRKLERARKIAKEQIVKGLSVERFVKDMQGESNIFKLVIGVFIIAILAGALIPTAVNSLVLGNNASGAWDAGTTATYGALPILIVICVVVVLAGTAYEAFDK